MSQPQCPAMSKTSGERCKRLVMIGATVCDFHGGKSRQAKRKAASRLAAAHAAEFLRDQEVRPIEDPIAELLHLTAEVRANYEFLRDNVAQLHVSDWEHVDDKRALQLSVYVEAMERAQERTGKFLTEMIRLGLEERMVQISEKLADEVFAALDRTLAAVELEPDTRSHLRLVLAEELAKAS